MSYGIASLAAIVTVASAVKMTVVKASWAALPSEAPLTFACMLLAVALAFGATLLAKKNKTTVEEADALPHDIAIATPADAQALRTELEAVGIITAHFGTGQSKTIDELFEELRVGECSIRRGCISGCITRRVDVVFVALHYDGNVLVEKSQVLADGRRRERRMLLAEKGTPQDRSPMVAARRGLRRKLGQESRDGGADGQDLFRFLRHDKLRDVCFTEEKDSASYPGLPCVYRNHRLHFEICEPADVAFRLVARDVPLGADFETDNVQAALRHEWTWMRLDEARRHRIKGLDVF